ncbi:MAG: HpaII family restriction endonuclease [Bacteroidota bacterium]
MLTGNKGEWREIYALLKLLGDTVLYPGNENVERIPSVIYPIIKILRSESNGDFEYSIKRNIVVVSGNKEVLKIPISKFKEKATDLLNHIKISTSRTFAVPEIEKFMREVNCISLKAKSSTKTDITIVIHDQRTNQRPRLGFSIKSQLGSASTLLNAGKTTNFTFRIEHLKLSSEEMLAINSIKTKSKIKDKIEVIRSKGGVFTKKFLIIFNKVSKLETKVLRHMCTN